MEFLDNRVHLYELIIFCLTFFLYYSNKYYNSIYKIYISNLKEQEHNLTQLDSSLTNLYAFFTIITFVELLSLTLIYPSLSLSTPNNHNNYSIIQQTMETFHQFHHSKLQLHLPHTSNNLTDEQQTIDNNHHFVL